MQKLVWAERMGTLEATQGRRASALFMGRERRIRVIDSSEALQTPEKPGGRIAG